MVAPTTSDNGKELTIKERISKAKEKTSCLEKQINELKSSRSANWSGLEVFSQDLVVTKSKFPLKPRKLLKGHFGKVYAADWAGSGTELVSASQDGKLIIWDAMLSAYLNYSFAVSTFFT